MDDRDASAATAERLGATVLSTAESPGQAVQGRRRSPVPARGEAVRHRPRR
ncbi:MAG: hypothetical protein M3170_01365 [Candidatus Dormibacteraeota bacterium]|nr:hypothetical protein [Candidatus Dormibacteraeota bacterium]